MHTAHLKAVRVISRSQSYLSCQ